MDKPRIIKTNPLINRSGQTRQTKYYTFNKKKFRIHFDYSNGSCMGFDSDMCLSQYDPERGEWNHLEDRRVLDLKENPNSYYDVPGSLKKMEEFFEKMEEHLEIVY